MMSSCCSAGIRSQAGTVDLLRFSWLYFGQHTLPFSARCFSYMSNDFDDTHSPAFFLVPLPLTTFFYQPGSSTRVLFVLCGVDDPVSLKLIIGLQMKVIYRFTNMHNWSKNVSLPQQLLTACLCSMWRRESCAYMSTVNNNNKKKTVSDGSECLLLFQRTQVSFSASGALPAVHNFPHAHTHVHIRTHTHTQAHTSKIPIRTKISKIKCKKWSCKR